MLITWGCAVRCPYSLHGVLLWIAVCGPPPPRGTDVLTRFVYVSCWLALVRDFLAVSRSPVQEVLPNRSAVEIRTIEKRAHMKDDWNVTRSCTTFSWLLSDENDREWRDPVAFDMRGLFFFLHYSLL